MSNLSVVSHNRASDGANFGHISIAENNSIFMESSNSKTILNFPLTNVAQCVITSNNRNELEIQFQDNDNRKDEDSLVQVTFHFPSLADTGIEEDDENEEDNDKDTPAEIFHKTIMDTGAIQDLAGNIIVEFPKEDGNFVSPRARYNVQVN